ncbi:hypothetical protein H8959_007585, partial [Pygathrix nigripes]
MVAQRCARRRSVGPLRTKLARQASARVLRRAEGREPSVWGQGHFSRASATESVSFSGIVQMDEDMHYDKVEDVVGSHIEDAVTFWAQSINRNKDIMKIGCSLSEVCPQASSVLGNLDPKKIYGGLFSEDKCWYRCKVLKIISDEKCLVRYIDYGNTEILNRSDIVEIPLELQFSSVAKKHVGISVYFGNDLSDAIQVLDEGCFTTPASLNGLEIIWAEYNLAQEKIKTCEYVNEGNILIAQRNEMQQKLYMSVEDFVLEVDESSLNKRLKTLQDLSVSLEAVYGEAKEGANSDEILKKFYDWKCDKREEFTNVRSETDASLQRLVAWFQRTLKVFDLSVEEPLISEDAVDNIDEILEKTESSVCKELEIALVDQGDADKEIILNTYSQVLQKIRSEERLIATVQAKYKDSIEFKKQLIEYLNKSPSVDHLLSIKKTLKSLKARLRWKLVEKNNLEE